MAMWHHDKNHNPGKKNLGEKNGHNILTPITGRSRGFRKEKKNSPGGGNLEKKPKREMLTSNGNQQKNSRLGKQERKSNNTSNTTLQLAKTY